MKNFRKSKWNATGVSIYFCLEMLGIALGFLFVFAAYLNEYSVLLSMSILILAIAWTQSQIEVKRRR
jgi:hypothetical protein